MAVEVPVKPHRQLVDGRKGDLLFTAAAAIGAGACFFILQRFQENWLPVSYRVGCITWIVICMPYLVRALLNTKDDGEASSDLN